MFKRILVTTDGSELSMKAVKRSIQLAKAVGAELTALNVTPEYPTSPLGEVGAVRIPAVVKKRFNEETSAIAKKYLTNIRAIAAEAGVDCHTDYVAAVAPYKAIIEYAKRIRSDLIVMGSHGRTGISRLVLGSETSKVIGLSTVPVLVIR